jgi:hypothetical protein
MAHDDAAAAGQAATCQWCPLCAGLAALRESRPEAVAHLMKAGVELLAAARALLDGADGPSRPAEPTGLTGPPRRRRQARPRPADTTASGRDGLQRIDVG